MEVKRMVLGSGYEEQAKLLIIEGLKEHWGDAFDVTFNPDLVNFEKYYLQPLSSSEEEAATMFVAMKEGLVVGTGALIPERQEGKENEREKENEKEKEKETKEERGEGKVVRIVRMSTRRDCRRQGIGGLILKELLREAKEGRKCDRVVVETTASWQEAIAFYLHWGFTPLGVSDGDMHFVYHLV